MKKVNKEFFIENFRIIIAVLAVVVFVIFSAYNSHIQKRDFINSGYSGFIYKIELIEGEHGDMNIKINDSWRRTGSYEYKMGEYIKIGDSVLKLPGKTEIIVYRKDTLNNKWIEKKIKNIFF